MGIEKYSRLIECAKTRLMKTAKSSGISENFGRDEVRRISSIKDKDVMFGKLDWVQGNIVMSMIASFSQWCENLNTETLKRL